jgi:hypothetical protein
VRIWRELAICVIRTRNPKAILHRRRRRRRRRRKGGGVVGGKKEEEFHNITIAITRLRDSEHRFCKEHFEKCRITPMDTTE